MTTLQPSDWAALEGAALSLPFALLGEGGLLGGPDGRGFVALNASAALIWLLLRESASEAELARRFGEAAGLDAAPARAMVAQACAAWLPLTRPEGDGTGAPAPGEPAPGELAEAAAPSALDAVYLVGTAPVRVRIGPPEVAAPFAPLAAPCRAPAGSAAGALVEVRGGAGAYRLEDGAGHVLRRFASPLGARWGAVREVARRSWPGCRFMALLHAAAVTTAAGEAVLIAGDSGRGKTTLTAGLLAAGHGYLADDIVPVEAGSGRVRPVPLAISVKRGSWPHVEPLLPGLARAPAARIGSIDCRFLARAPAVRADAPPLRIAAVLFPGYAAGAAARAERLDAEAAFAGLGNAGSVLPGTSADLDAFLRLIERTPCWRLGYGSLADGVRLATEALCSTASPA